MENSYRIINGRVIDPASGVDEIRSLAIRNSRIVADDASVPAAEVVDASGCLVLPGLIDFHTHLARHHSDLGIAPDLMNLPNGITAAVDAGSGGSANFEGFQKDIVCASEITIKSYLNVAATGIITEQYFENPDPALYDIDRIEYMFERYREDLLGLKIRIGKLFSGRFGLEPLRAAKKLATRLGTTVCVHAVHPESPYDEILDLLDAGDVLCHCFQAKGDFTILAEDGSVGEAARAARKRGVLFDGASGRANYSLDVAGKALADGFPPDVISTDVVTHSMYKIKVFALPYVMSYYHALGMPLTDVIRAVTATPARIMRLAGQIGTLAEGALADVAIVSLKEKDLRFKDQFSNAITGSALFKPQMTIKAGRTAWMDMEFAIAALPPVE